MTYIYALSLLALLSIFISFALVDFYIFYSLLFSIPFVIFLFTRLKQCSFRFTIPTYLSLLCLTPFLITSLSASGVIAFILALLGPLLFCLFIVIDVRGFHPSNHDFPVKPRFIYLFYFLFLFVFSTYKFLSPDQPGDFYAGTQAIVVSLFPFAFYSFKSSNSKILQFLFYSLSCFYIVYSLFVGTRTILLCLIASLVFSHLFLRMRLYSLDPPAYYCFSPDIIALCC